MYRFAAKLLRLFPSDAAIGRAEESARSLVSVSRSVDFIGITRVHDKLIEHKAGLIKVHEQLPRAPSIAGCMYLAVKCADEKMVLVTGIDRDHAHVAAARAHNLPVLVRSGR